METQSAPLGMNRTGIQTSPLDTKKLLEAAGATPASAGDELGIGQVRLAYIAEADALGSVPPPGTIKGILKSGAKMMTGKRPQVLIDKLGERLAFERTGSRLYEALLVKYDAYVDELAAVPRERLQQIHADEMQHFAMLREAIESLGGDPTAQTPCADLTAVEGMGWVQVLADPRTTFAQSLHTILLAELADVDGWDLLISVTEGEGNTELAQRFTAARAAEESHLDDVRRWLAQLTLGEARVLT
jgi:rubrerythrin